MFHRKHVNFVFIVLEILVVCLVSRPRFPFIQGRNKRSAIPPSSVLHSSSLQNGKEMHESGCVGRLTAFAQTNNSHSQHLHFSVLLQTQGSSIYFHNMHKHAQIKRQIEMNKYMNDLNSGECCFAFENSRSTPVETTRKCLPTFSCSDVARS